MKRHADKVHRLKTPVRRILFTGAVAVLSIASAFQYPARGQDEMLDGDKGIGDILDDIQEKVDDRWWNADWKYRRKLSINDPALLENNGLAIFLTEPEPLLLYNLGRCADKGADIRIIGANGQPVPGGVTHFGRDDGSSMVWCVPPRRDNQKMLEFYVYYGNPAAEPLKDELPEAGGRKGDPQFVQIGGEEVREGEQPPVAVPGSFFKSTIAVEAESFQAENPAADALIKREEIWVPHGEASYVTASGESYLTLQKEGELSKPITLWRTVSVHEAGTWQVHFRYKSPEGRTKYSGFKLLIGGKELEFGTKHDLGHKREGGSAFNWQSAQVELPKGDIKIGLQLTGLAAPDLLMLSRDARYLPDCRDVNGPAWMRFNVRNPEVKPFYVDLFGTYITFNVNGMQGKTAGYLFKDRMVQPKRRQWTTDNGGIIITSEIPPYLEKLPQDTNNLLRGKMWSPWCQTFGHGSYTWFSEARIIPGGKTPPPLPKNLTIDSEFATRPDPSRIFRNTFGTTNDTNGFYIHMPPTVDLPTVKKDTITFTDWADQRFEIAKSLGFKAGEGPKKIITCTIANAYGPQEADLVLKTLDWIGLNTMTMQARGFDPEPILKRANVRSFWNYYRTEYRFDKHFMTVDPKEMVVSATGRPEPKYNPRPPRPGLTNGQTIERIIAEQTDRYYRESIQGAMKTRPYETTLIHYNDLDDEIGPAVDARTINEHPMFKGFFIEYLKSNKLQPSFFGLKSWDELEAVNYDDIGKKEKRDIQLAKDAEAARKKLDDVASAEIDKTGELMVGLDDPVKDNDKEAKEKKRKEELGIRDERPVPTQFEKRNYYWVCKFRSFYTALFYKHESAAAHRYLPNLQGTCANLQASPVQCGRMWGGALNIWDLGRLNGFTSLQLEDWHGSPVNVNFGMHMLRAAARKNHQTLTGLMVGRNPAQRIIANVMQGTRHMLFYQYGPVQGDPAFAEDRETLRQIGTALRQVARTENDILAAKNREADAAILIDNASEVNGEYFNYPFDHDRMSVYAALLDAQIPVDLVGAEEILEDNALSRYKVLYVCDPHVRASVQEKIKAWVAAGGTLWADYAAMARQEYDEPTTIMNEVLGLKSRGPIEPYEIKNFSGTFPENIIVKIPASDLFKSETIPDVHYTAAPHPASINPSYQVSTGKVLATFGDGKPAIVSNKFGKGQSLLVGFIAGLAYGGQYKPHGYNFSHIARTEPATPLRGQLMTALARKSGVRPHVKLDAHMCYTSVQDGPTQTVVMLINGSEKDLKNKPLEVMLKKPVKSAFSGSKLPVTYKMKGANAVVPLNLKAGETEILVFKY